ncbi:MAG: glycosyltransferase family 2 protein [Ruminococcaceae bacterium]|nr:glycosyltransferase family 2 protein [Oscillospiraceae bacterium]
MFFSVIVPVYKVEKYLRKCIESVLNQSFSDFELILVNDGSLDNCPNICEEYKNKDSRVKVVHKENGGLASARQAGIKVAEGNYVYSLDSDDAIEKDTLKLCYKIISEYNCDIVTSGYKWVSFDRILKITDDGLKEGFYSYEDIRKVIFPRLLMDKNMEHISYYLSGKAVKRELLSPIQLSLNPKISLGEDLCTVVPCYLQAKSVYISKEASYLYTVRQDSISKDFNSRQILLIEDVINELKGISLEKPKDFDAQLDRYSYFMCLAITAAAAEGGFLKSAGELKRNIKSSLHHSSIKKAKFDKISKKSRITLLLMKAGLYITAFYFLDICKKIKVIFKRG